MSETTTIPVPIQTYCPDCAMQHVDEGEWATKLHKTHLCAYCGFEWRPSFVPTVGIPGCVTCAGPMEAREGVVGPNMNSTWACAVCELSIAEL